MKSRAKDQQQVCVWVSNEMSSDRTFESIQAAKKFLKEKKFRFIDRYLHRKGGFMKQWIEDEYQNTKGTTQRLTVASLP